MEIEEHRVKDLYSGVRGTAVKILDRIERTDSYLDKLLDIKYNEFFNVDQNKNIAEDMYNMLIGEGVLNAIFAKNNLKIDKNLSYIDYLKMTSSEVLQVLKAFNGLSTEDEKTDKIKYNFNCQKYIEGLMAIMQGYKINITDYASMFDEEIKTKFKKVIGSVSWGKSKYSKQYIFCNGFK